MTFQLEDADDLFRSLMAVSTDGQLEYLHHLVVSQMKARGLTHPKKEAEEVENTVPVAQGKWKKVPSNVKTPPTKEQKEAARLAKLQKSAGPYWDADEKTYYYRCCTKDNCDGRVYVSYKDTHDEYDSDEEDDTTKYVEKTFMDMHKTMDNTGLFVHGLYASDHYEAAREEVLAALKGVAPKSTRVKPGDEFGFVYFDNHAKAVKAQQLLIEAGYKANFLRRA